MVLVAQMVCSIQVIKSSLTYSQQWIRMNHLRRRICAALLPILPACSCRNVQIQGSYVKFIQFNPFGKSVFMDSLFKSEVHKNISMLSKVEKTKKTNKHVKHCKEEEYSLKPHFKLWWQALIVSVIHNGCRPREASVF